MTKPLLNKSPGLCVIIQARRSSSRLKDKILLPLNGTPVLAHVIQRCKQIKAATDVVVTYPDNDSSGAIHSIAVAAGARTSTGPEDDVLARYMRAAESTKAHYIMRITADCPLVDPGVCDQLFTLAVREKADFGGIGGYPHGLDCEIFTKALLESTHEKATHPSDREHVTLAMKRDNALKKVTQVWHGEDERADNRWVLDYPADYEFLKAVFSYLPAGDTPSWLDILDICNANPAIKSINQALIEEWDRKNQSITQSSTQNITLLEVGARS